MQPKPCGCYLRVRRIPMRPISEWDHWFLRGMAALALSDHLRALDVIAPPARYLGRTYLRTACACRRSRHGVLAMGPSACTSSPEWLMMPSAVSGSPAGRFRRCGRMGHSQNLAGDMADPAGRCWPASRRTWWRWPAATRICGASGHASRVAARSTRTRSVLCLLPGWPVLPLRLPPVGRCR